MKTFDLIVVGGGPAGSTAAYFAAKAGLTVLMLEKDRDIGMPVRCGEATSEAGLRQFFEPEPSWIASTIHKISMQSPGGTKITFESKHKGFVLHRRIFDYQLANYAAKAGAEILTKAYVYDVIMENDTVVGVKYEHLGKKFEVRSKVVIAADGVESRVGRMAGMRTALKLGDADSCFQYTVSNIDIDEEIIQFYLGKKIAPGGYLWVFPKGNGQANIGLGVNGFDSKNIKAIDLLNKFMQEQYPKASPLTSVCGLVPVSHTLKKIVSNGIMLTGDAARMVNPVTGGGIIAGMHGGKLAALTAVEAIAKNDVSAQNLKPYEDKWDKAAGTNHRRLYRIANALATLEDDDFNKIAVSLEKYPAEELSLLKIFTQFAMIRPKVLIDVTKAYIGF
jgi:digeranylgeranylglycerophospholipid reductase